MDDVVELFDTLAVFLSSYSVRISLYLLHIKCLEFSGGRIKMVHLLYLPRNESHCWPTYFFKDLIYELIVIFLATVKSWEENFLRLFIPIENNQFFTRGFCGFFAFHSAVTKSSGCSYWVGVCVCVCVCLSDNK